MLNKEKHRYSYLKIGESTEIIVINDPDVREELEKEAFKVTRRKNDYLCKFFLREKYNFIERLIRRQEYYWSYRTAHAIGLDKSIEWFAGDYYGARMNEEYGTVHTAPTVKVIHQEGMNEAWPAPGEL
tara:strand:+ start:1490 stop:1873 length:384 start_codon:yes stop_codon:yes gene_type:complete